MTWTATQRIRALAFVVLASAMIVVPLAVFAQDGARFGWRMFSFSDPFPELTLVDEDGTRTVVDPIPYIGRLRGDVPFGDALPPHLCAVVPGTARVVVSLGGEESEFDCP